jgi:hypothetical protein
MVDLSASFFTYSDQLFTVQSSNFPQDSTVYGWTEVFSSTATIVSASLFSLKTQQPAPGIADLPLLDANQLTPSGVLARLSISPTNPFLPRITRFSFVLVSTLYPLSTGQSFAPVNIQGKNSPLTSFCLHFLVFTLSFSFLFTAYRCFECFVLGESIVVIPQSRSIPHPCLAPRIAQQAGLQPHRQ